eukprot:TRINITY_DN31215_c0_g1_i1.p5 TRINITY_DN31215_c0_g1~~TRINITY_DN31215_c0_g1_i1.p5  ORF type:complete len:124 (-),score=13.46 TRINITY_DN31215_c0_g1_i1:130-501(-)
MIHTNIARMADGFDAGPVQKFDKPISEIVELLLGNHKIDNDYKLKQTWLSVKIQWYSVCVYCVQIYWLVYCCDWTLIVKSSLEILKKKKKKKKKKQKKIKTEFVNLSRKCKLVEMENFLLQIF